MGVWERNPQPPEAGVWGQSLQSLEARGSGGGVPSAQKLVFFCKNNFILGYFDKKIMLLKRGLEIGSANMIKLVA